MWRQILLNEFNNVVWHVSWSLTSNMLAVSGGDNKVTIWKEDHNGKYVCINDPNLNNSSDK
jgi:protein transport protein SEC13